MCYWKVVFVQEIAHTPTKQRDLPSHVFVGGSMKDNFRNVALLTEQILGILQSQMK
jgi:hypothetical protein